MKLTCFRSANDLDDVASQQRPLAACTARPMQDRAALEVPAAANQRQPVAERLGFAVPEDDGLVGPHDPLPVGGVKVDRDAAEGPAPLDHRGVVVRVRDGDGRDAAQRLDRLDHGFVKQRQAVPQDVACGVRTNKARWPMAKGGSMPMPISPGSSNRIELRLVSRSSSSVVHCWPVALTYCRSSWQMAQAAGGWSLSAYCVPQVVQMKFGMIPPPSFVTGVILPARWRLRT